MWLLKEAERSRRQIHDTFHDGGINEMIVNIKKSYFSRQ